MKLLLSRIFAILLTLLVSLCTSFAESPVRVGAIVPLTGPGAAYGEAIKNGVELAKSDRPGLVQNLEVIWEDSHLDGAAAVSAYRKLLAKDHVGAILVWGAGPADAVVPIAAREQVPVFAITADRAISIGRPNVFRFHYHAADYVRPLATYIRERKLKRLALLATQIAYFDAIARALRAELGTSASIEEAGSYTPGETDFRSTIARLKAGKYDGLLVFLLPGQISTFHQQADQLGLRVPVFDTDFYDSIDEVQKAGQNAYGVVFPAFQVSDTFRQRYLKRFGNDVQLPYAANTYDFFTFLLREVAALPVSNRSGEALIKPLRNAAPFKGVSGEYHYVESKDGSGFDVQVFLKEVQNGNLGYVSMHDNLRLGPRP